MMFVWWAVFFFAGAIVPAGCSGAGAALGAASLLTSIPGRPGHRAWPRFFLTCATGLLVLVTASLSPIDSDLLSGSSMRAVSGIESFPAPARAVRDGIIRITDDRLLADDTQSLLRALLVADRSSLPFNIRRDFRRTGTSHYLALSGLHLGLIALPLFGILTLCGARGIFRDSIALFVLSFYAAVAGRPGSLLRALSMMAVIRTFRMAGIRTGLAQCVITGAFIVCILDPGSLSDTGFLLSFNAAAGVALLGVPACVSLQRLLAGKRLSRVMLPPLLAISMSLCVQASMLPLAVRIFGIAPLSGPVMSAILSLPVTFLLYGGFMYVIAGHLLARAAAFPLNILSALATFIVSRGAELSKAGLIISDFDIRLYIPGLAVCALAMRTVVRRKWLLAAGSLMVALSFVPFPAGREDGEGPVPVERHGAHLFGENNGILVLDQCPASWSVHRLSRTLRRSGVRRIKAFVILGTDRYDAEGLSALAADFVPERVYLSPWLDGECPADIDCEYVSQERLLEAGTVRIIVRPPDVLPGKGARAGRNESSLTISPLD